MPRSAEVTFVGVTTDQFRPGKRLSKSLFSQILYDYPTDESYEILGWVNYFPSSWAKFPRSIGEKKTEGWLPRIDQDILHILWRTTNGELRRHFMFKPKKDEDPERQTFDAIMPGQSQWDKTVAIGQLYLVGNR